MEGIHGSQSEHTEVSSGGAGRGTYLICFLPLEWFVPEFVARLVQLYGVPGARLLGRAPPPTTLLLRLLVLLGTLGILVGRGRRRFMLQKGWKSGTQTRDAAAYGSTHIGLLSSLDSPQPS